MRARLLTPIAYWLALAACTVVSVDPEVGSSGAPPSDASTASDGAPGERDGSALDGPEDSDAAAETCVATGTLKIDPTFAAKTIPMALVRGAPAPAGRMAVVGRSSCADGGGLGVELRFLESNGDPSTDKPECVAEGSELVESLTPREGSGWEIGTSVGTGVYNAVLRSTSLSGLVQNTRTRNGFFHQLATRVGTSTVWAGYREAPSPDGTGFLGIAGGAITELPGERVVAAGARGTNLFALVMMLASPASPTLTLRKYVVGAAVTEDPVARSQPATLSPAASPFSFNGAESILVEGTKVTAAVPVPNAIAIYEYVDGTGWSPKASVASLANPASLVRSCDGSLLLAYVSSAGGHRLARFVDGTSTPTSEITISGNASARSVIRDSRGRILVFQSVGGGQGMLVRVVP